MTRALEHLLINETAYHCFLGCKHLKYRREPRTLKKTSNALVYMNQL